MRRVSVVFLLVFAAAGVAQGASAQELTQRFVNPGFGGNPFNSDYLMATATAQRPERKADASTAEELTEAQLFARQIQSRLLSALSSSVVEAITGSKPGTTGEFVVGDQTISFERTLTEIRLTITDNKTGETTTIAVPVLNFNDATGQAGVGTTSAASKTAESLIAGGSLTTAGTLASKPLEGGQLTTGSGSLETPLPGGGF